MTEKEYRTHPAISRSDLWKIRNPEKFKYEREHPSEPTPALLFGQVTHKLLLQPEDYDIDFVTAPEIDRRTKTGRADWEEFLAVAGDRTVVPRAVYDQAKAMTDSAREVPFVAQLLSGEHETPFFWIDELTEEACKCRIDAGLTLGGGIVIVDYKTTTDASDDAFLRDAFRYGYDFQSAMYLEGVCMNRLSCGVLEALQSVIPPKFVFIVQEKDPPYAVNIFDSDAAFIRHGYDTYRELLGVYHYCRTSNDWYGYLGKYQTVNTLGLPKWMKEE